MTMTTEEIDAFLSEPRLCHFATIDADGHPRVRPLWFLWSDGVLWLTTRTDARHTGRDLRSNPDAAVSIASEERPYRAVVFHGSPEVTQRDPDRLLAIAARYGDQSGRRWLASALKEPDRVLLKLVPREVLSWDYSRERTDGSKRTSLTRG
jgi:PPOX class probable F420-dependent enzyme